ncbi:arsenate reductase (glutaredoxin) [Psychroflexus maritimus]|uniref:Arsenate reductase (Glutaredoxin) n=1 Tax=Psychroflexus maritimus TaxID=2714865 RepID=A0A967AE87_9FLAO|nr:arsenate reductase (glutaredoxin) [Psychroflexus maritimus]NGZ89668.1 arsenate reductase (glutaredoxin) [Psychroflexus maritimus]
MKIYHNPRCRKSREGLQILEESGKDFQVIKYLVEVPSKEELKSILEKLDYKPAELVRKTEKVWKENYKGKNLSDDELIEAMLTYPKLIERPIVVTSVKAVVGRPPEKIKELF